LRYASFEERVRAAQSAGFTTIGLFAARFAKLLRQGWTPHDVADLATAHGLRIAEVEGLFGWAGSAADRDSSSEQERLLYLMADAFGADHLLTVGPPPGTFGVAGRRELANCFGALCDRAADHGLRVALEFVPILTEPGDLSSALEIVELADRPNGGICIDAWHFFRGERQFDLLETFPADRLVLLQLCDGPLVPVNPDYEADTLTNRLLPGDGEFDLTRFAGSLLRAPDAYVSVEVFSTVLQQLPHDETARLLAASGHRTLAAAGHS
jgi:sugar phosphate isomerase/epimerase